MTHEESTSNLCAAEYLNMHWRRNGRRVTLACCYWPVERDQTAKPAGCYFIFIHNCEAGVERSQSTGAACLHVCQDVTKIANPLSSLRDVHSSAGPVLAALNGRRKDGKSGAPSIKKCRFSRADRVPVLLRLALQRRVATIAVRAFDRDRTKLRFPLGERRARGSAGLKGREKPPRGSQSQSQCLSLPGEDKNKQGVLCGAVNGLITGSSLCRLKKKRIQKHISTAFTRQLAITTFATKSKRNGTEMCRGYQAEESYPKETSAGLVSVRWNTADAIDANARGSRLRAHSSSKTYQSKTRSEAQ